MDRLRHYTAKLLSFLPFEKRSTELTATAIYKAAKTGHFTKLEELLFHSLEIPDKQNLLNAEDAKGKTPLIVALLQGHIDCVDLLLAHGADVHHVGWNPKGGTPLHEAVASWAPKNLIYLLLEHGGSPFMENLMQLTPWDLALRRKDPSLLREFEKQGKFCQYLLMKTVDFRTKEANWERRWFAVIPRFACSRISEEQRQLSTMLVAFEDTTFYEPLFQLKLEDAQAVAVSDQAIGTEIVITTPAVDDPSRSRHVVVENGKIKLWLSGSDKVLNSLMRALKGHGIEMTSDRGIVAVSLDEDFELAKRLQGMYDRDAQLCPPPRNGESSSSSQAGPSASGSSQFHASVPPVAEEQSACLSCPLPDLEKTGPVAGSTAGGTSQQKGDDLCIVCLDAAKSAGFAHGDSVHWCVCKSCAKRMWTSGDRCCPLCRKGVDNIITKFYAN